MNHTPGPWEYRRAFVNNEPDCFVVITGKWGAPTIAKCWQQEDAAAIAALPEMRTVLELAHDHIFNSDADGARDLRARIEAVLKKGKV